MASALIGIAGYRAVIPKIQNVYFVEHDENAGSYYWGFKYDSGVFEFFHHKTSESARAEYERCCAEIDEYWMRVGLATRQQT